MKQIQSSSITTNMLFARIKILSKTTEGAQRAHQLRPMCIGTVRSRNQLSINQSINQSRQRKWNRIWQWKVN